MKTFRIGNTYKDRGATSKDGDEFLAWVSIPGSGMLNFPGIRPLKYVHNLSALPAYLILVTRRVVEDSEYTALVSILLNPPVAPSRRNERNSLWRDAGDAVQLLRMTVARFNELLRIRLDQFKWSKGVVTRASKTENERDLPIWDCVRDVVQRRINEGLTDNEYLFPRAKTKTFDNAIARACRKAAKLANINYGQANGFTCHSFRHTFVTRMMEATGNDVALVMSYSGHRSMESFKIYLHPTQKGSILAN